MLILCLCCQSFFFSLFVWYFPLENTWLYSLVPISISPDPSCLTAGADEIVIILSAQNTRFRKTRKEIFQLKWWDHHFMGAFETQYILSLYQGTCLWRWWHARVRDDLMMRDVFTSYHLKKWFLKNKEMWEGISSELSSTNAIFWDSALFQNVFA